MEEQNIVVKLDKEDRKRIESVVKAIDGINFISLSDNFAILSYTNPLLLVRFGACLATYIPTIGGAVKFESPNEDFKKSLRKFL